mmetsp:Transcript_23124/g.35681  ORF Transcript_23124/g.35681 Transcript_23124/m.35681 type:complete len:135 (-) Transcript_23124:227-631(-)
MIFHGVSLLSSQFGTLLHVHEFPISMLKPLLAAFANASVPLISSILAVIVESLLRTKTMNYFQVVFTSTSFQSRSNSPPLCAYCTPPEDAALHNASRVKQYPHHQLINYSKTCEPSIPTQLKSDCGGVKVKVNQ